MGLKGNYKIKENPLPWLEWIVSGDSHKNFFEGVVTDYNAAGMSGSWSLDISKLSSSFDTDECLACQG
jgi:ribonucleoside-diphosphate reductase beta chain